MESTPPDPAEPQEIHPLAEAGPEDRSAIFTRREVAEFVLDLAGYTEDQPLHRFRLLEPSFGEGGFLLVVVERLLSAYTAQVKPGARSILDLQPAIRAVEVHLGSVEHSRRALLGLMLQRGLSGAESRALLAAWIIEGDFLLAEFDHRTFTHVVGNPPYLRLERISKVLVSEYRRRYHSIFGRAGLYLPFIERGLTSLAPGGRLAYICPDRWMKSRSGASLRAMVARDYHLTHYVEMSQVRPFLSTPLAYPAVTIIRRERPGPTRTARLTSTEPEALKAFAGALKVPRVSAARRVLLPQGGREPWLLGAGPAEALVKRLEETLPLLEETGCTVGIGLATGADEVLIGTAGQLNVEVERRLPILTTADIRGGSVNWGGLFVLNPFEDDGKLVDLAHYPRLAHYVAAHADRLKRRSYARRYPEAWYRPKDRVRLWLLETPKLLVPDILRDPLFVMEDGRYYPHHNLYYLTSKTWNLRLLKLVLQAGIGKLFVSAYTTPIRGGYLRFQAQHLRRIRLPQWMQLPQDVRRGLWQAAEGHAEIHGAVCDLYGLQSGEAALLRRLARPDIG